MLQQHLLSQVDVKAAVAVVNETQGFVLNRVDTRQELSQELSSLFESLRVEDSMKQQERNIWALASGIQAKIEKRASSSALSSPREAYMLVSDASKATFFTSELRCEAKVLILSSVDLEAQSTAVVLQQLAQRRLLLQVHILKSGEEVSASCALVLLTEGHVFLS